MPPPRSCRFDRYGDWRIAGRDGHVFADGKGYLIVVTSNDHASPSRAPRIIVADTVADLEIEGPMIGFARTVLVDFALALSGAYLGVYQGTDWPRPQRTLRSSQRIAVQIASASQEVRRHRRRLFAPLAITKTSCHALSCHALWLGQSGR
jgi:hypothetical protein